MSALLTGDSRIPNLWAVDRTANSRKIILLRLAIILLRVTRNDVSYPAC